MRVRRYVNSIHLTLLDISLTYNSTDTDSVFCHLPRSLCDGKTPEETVKRAEEIGREMGEYVDKHFLRPVELEFEKVYLPFLLLKKKRYCGKKYEEGHVKIDMKGLECVRRDFCPLLVDTQKKMLKTLVNMSSIWIITERTN